MKKYFVRLANRQIVEWLDTDTDVTEMFHPDLQWREVNQDDFQAAKNAALVGKKVFVNATGSIEVEVALAPSLSVLSAEVISLARSQRGPIIAMLDGMQASAITLADMPRAQLIETAKQALRDITKVDLSQCADAAAMKVVIMTRYKAIAAALPADIRTSFAQALL